jgi:PKD repeat protein
VGPYNVRRNASTSVAGPLTVALDKRSHFYDEVVSLAPPEATGQCVPLSNPAGPPASITSCVTASLQVGVTATSARPMQIEWGDGTAPAVLTTAVELTHLYATANTYTITVRFTDLAMEEKYLVATVPCP